MNHDEVQLAKIPLEWRTVLQVAAILEYFDAAALAAITTIPATEILPRLVGAGLIRSTSEGYQIAEKAQRAALTASEALPAAQLRDLYRQATAYYAAQLEAAPADKRSELEQRYMRNLERYCELLIQQERKRLAEEMAAAPLHLLVTPRHRQLLRYYQALGEGLCDRLSEAQARFSALLDDPELDDLIRGRTLNSSAIFARVQGDYERARKRYQESLLIWRRLNNALREGFALLNLGVLYYELREYAAAETSLVQSLELFSKEGASYHQAQAYNNLGLLCRDRGDWNEALRYFELARINFEHTGAYEDLQLVANNSGEVELLRGHLDAAQIQFERVQSQLTMQVLADETAINLGLVSQARGEHEKALGYYRRALELALEHDRRGSLALIHSRIAQAEQRLGREEEAMVSYSAAAEAIEAIREPLGDESLLISLMGRWQQVYEAAIQLCLARGDVAAAFDYTERARARAFADLLARRGAGLGNERATPITTKEAQRALPPGTVLLTYFGVGLRGPESRLLDAIPSSAAGVRALFAMEPQLVLLALTSTDIHAHICQLDPNKLQAPSPYLADGRRFLKPAILRRAYDALIGPVEHLLEQAHTLVIIPHGPLHQLPFAALLDSADQPLCERVPHLLHAPSATVLLGTSAMPRHPQQTCLAIGYDGDDGQLQHTEAEAAAIAELCGGVSWHGEAGLRQAFIQEAPRYRWLHLACHGEVDLEDPLNSWLEIGPGEQLKAADVITDITLNADLVTLSACRSGLSYILRGDEPMGLVRGFLSAGAGAVLATLWRVEDVSARLLMERFYSTLLAQGVSTDPASALHQAQTYVRTMTAAEVHEHLARRGHANPVIPGDEGSCPYAAPEYWAPYVLVSGAAAESTTI